MNLYIIAIFVFLIGCFAEPPPPNRVFEWSHLALQTYKQNADQFWVGFRNHAILHLSIQEALKELGCHQRTSSKCSEEAANLTIDFAAQYVLKEIYPDLFATWEGFMRPHFRASGPAIQSLAQEIGEKNAGKVLKQTAADKSSSFVDYVPSGLEGRWTPTPPAFVPAILLQYRNAVPFAIPSANFYIVSPPPSVTDPAFASSYLEIYSLGVQNSTIRTPDETEAAIFFAGEPIISETVIANYIRAAEDIIRQRGTGLYDSAVIASIISQISFDCVIADIYNKVVYDRVRPVSAIRNGLPSAPSLPTDSNWTPLLVTPPNSEYPAGHCTIVGAAGTALRLLFGGNDNVSFTIYSSNPALHDRSFTSFSQLMYEGGKSRVWGGVHFEYSNQAGQDLGRHVGQTGFDTLCPGYSCFRRT